MAAVRYYLHTALTGCVERWRSKWHHGVTNYTSFVDQIERWRVQSQEHVLFVTFNYDTMLEDAISQVLHYTIDDIGGYTRHRNYTVIKLHGSVNWGREVDEFDVPFSPRLPRNPVTHQDLIDKVNDLQITFNYRLVRGCPMLRDKDHLVFPALSIPVENKDIFECPPTHVARLEELLPMVSKVITIGWRATEAEFLNRFHRVVSNEELHLMIVSGDDRGAKETLSNLTNQRELLNPRLSIVASGFSGLILRDLGQLESFLRAT